jgi:hypothetical protein
MGAPQNRQLYGKMKSLPLWAKHMGSKQGVIGNTFGEHIGNLWNILRIQWEPIGNLKGTSWEQRKNEKNPPTLPPPPHPRLKRRENKVL